MPSLGRSGRSPRPFRDNRRRANALRDEAAIAPYLIEPRDKFRGRTPLVLRPGAVDEVAAILRLANETGTPIVPQGGNTGVVGGQIPDRSGREIVVSLSRLNRIREVDTEGDTMTVEAGVILADAQHAADAADRLFPMSLASEGSCQIGGNLSTNAGGTAVLAYGNTRELVLGVEVVLASGEVWNGLRTLRKDNTGYDLTRPLHRRRGDARHHHRGGAEAVSRSRAARASPSSASRTRRRRFASSTSRGQAPARPHRLRADPADRHRRRCSATCRARATRSPAGTPGTC